MSARIETRRVYEAPASGDGRRILIALLIGLVACAARASHADEAPRGVRTEGITDSKFELFVTDVEESIRFYATLGFEVAHRKSGGYTTLRSGSSVIALSPIPSWLPLRWLGFLRSPPIGTEIVLYTDRLEVHRAALLEAGYEPGEIALQPWGDRDFRIDDYEGYYVRITEGTVVPGLGAGSAP